jgi:hypothetical protein
MYGLPSTDLQYLMVISTFINATIADARDGQCRAPNLWSFVHHVSVPGSVADTHNSNKIDIKNHTFIANGETYYRVRVYVAWAISLIANIRVLRQQSYVIVAPFLQAT